MIFRSQHAFLQMDFRPEGEFPLGQIMATETVEGCLRRHGMTDADLKALLTKHAYVLCGCGSQACVEHQRAHLRLGGTIVTSHLLHDPMVTLDDILWIRTNPERNETIVATADDLDWDQEDPLLEVHSRGDA